MNTFIDFLSLILVSGGIQGIFLSIALSRSKRPHSLANQILAFHLFLFSVFIIFPELISRYYRLFPHLIASYFPTTLLLGPSLLFYIRSITKSGLVFHKNDLMHLIPFLLNILYLIPFYLQPGFLKIHAYERIVTEGMPLEFVIMWAITSVHILTYLFMAIRLFNRHAKNSSLHSQWLFKLLIGNSVVWGIYVLTFFAYQAGLSSTVFILSQKFFSLSMSVFIYTIGYIAIRQPKVFTKTAEAIYAKSGLSEDRASAIFNKLVAYMESEKPYVDPLISVKKISTHLSLSPNHLSQVINQKLNQNFYSFINSYRINYSKTLLEHAQSNNMSITEVAYSAGFNSVSTFNAAFKKNTSQTPSEYRKKFNQS